MRLHQVAYQLSPHREGGRAVSARDLADLAGFAPPTLHSLGVRVAGGLSRRYFNLLVTNVPGPQEPMYCAGARLAETYPVIPLSQGHALAVGVTSLRRARLRRVQRRPGRPGRRRRPAHVPRRGARRARGGRPVSRPAARAPTRRPRAAAPARAGRARRRPRPGAAGRPRVRPRAAHGRPATGRPHRWGLVLGGGGVLGGAWMVGALTAYEEVTGRDCRDADVLVGTSAGAFAAAILGQRGERRRLAGPPGGAARSAAGRWPASPGTTTSTPAAPRPPPPGRRPGSPRLVAGNVRRLRRLPPTAVLSAFVPEGRGSLARIGETVAALGAGDGWVARGGVRVVALDYDTGHRTVFAGPRDEPGADRVRTRTSAEASLAEAVMASCAIPGWYAPVTIARHRYVDGGAWSSTNVDLLAGDGLDEVVVVAPMVSFAPDRPRSFAQIVDRQWRASVTSRCLREVAAVHAAGTAVTVLGPGAEDLAVMGTNVMAPERRARRAADLAADQPRGAAGPRDDPRRRAGPGGRAAADRSAPMRVYVPTTRPGWRACARTACPAGTEGYAVTDALAEALGLPAPR